MSEFRLASGEEVVSVNDVIISCPANGPPCIITTGDVYHGGTGPGSGLRLFYDRTGGTPVFMVAPGLPLRDLGHGSQAPVVNDLAPDLKGIHVGADVMPVDRFRDVPGGRVAPTTRLASASTLYDVPVASGWLQDGVGAEQVVAFLKEHALFGEFKNTVGLETYSAPPVVRVAEGTSDELIDYTVRALQLVNAALPFEKRISLSQAMAPPRVALDEVPDSEIFIDFAPWRNWNSPHRRPALGIAEADLVRRYNEESGQWEVEERRASHIWIDGAAIPDDELVPLVIARELLHSLGFTAHVDRTMFPLTIMGSSQNGWSYWRRFGHILSPLDREALLAALTRFGPGDTPEELTVERLGPWDDHSYHVRGSMDLPDGPMFFGVASRNALPQPWAFGPTPWTNLTDNPDLSETIRWEGALLGATPSATIVAGRSRLVVELDTLDGTLDLTDLEHWGANEAPDEAGTGVTWGDGDLEYSVKVEGNTFVQTAGDSGTVTGVFFGAHHDGMGGVLERDDISAAFGGKR